MGKYAAFKLPKGLKKKWVNALRSGKYLQGPDALLEEHHVYDDDGRHQGIEKRYCCLGVLADVCGIPENETMGVGLLDGRTWVSELPDSWKEPVFNNEEIVYSAERIEVNGDKRTIQGVLSVYNDRGKSFKWIASFIERYL